MPSQPQPIAPEYAVSERMKRVGTTGTGPELRVRRVVRRAGISYTTKTQHLPGRPDLLLPKFGLAIFVHGCFWHGCDRCFVAPQRNRNWWLKKIERTRLRDRRKANQLRLLGFSVLTIREHDDDSRIERRLLTAVESTLKRPVGPSKAKP